MSFTIGDKIAHPLHGAGIIDHIEKRRIDGRDCEYFVLRMPAGDIMVMVPVENCEAAGVRAVMSPEAMEKLLSEIPDAFLSMTSNWNKRYRENMDYIKSGDLLKVAAVIKGLMDRDAQKTLSTQERKMMNSARQLIESEMILSMNIPAEQAGIILDEALSVRRG